jgi:lipoprotein-anchoring transpeptidase ErfK/SrfK
MWRRLMLLLVVASVIASLAMPIAGVVTSGQSAFAQDVDGTPAAEPTETEEPTVEATETATATEEPTETATATEEPTETATATATVEPSETVTAEPTDVPASPAAPSPSATSTVTLATTTSDIEITLSCWGDPEMTRIDNTGDAEITIISVGSLANPTASEPYVVNRKLGAGRTVIYRSGPGATSGSVLTTNNLYVGTMSPNEGVHIETSVGAVEADCGTNPSIPVTSPSEIHITLNCIGNPETTRVDNTGDAAIRILSIESLADQTSKEPYNVDRKLGSGSTVIFRSGPGATSGTILTTSSLYTNSLYENDGVRLVTDVGTIEKRCAPKPPPTYPTNLQVSIDCAGSPETATIKNAGQGTVTLTRLNSLYVGASFSLNKQLAPGQTIVYRSGGNSGANLLTSNYIYDQSAGTAEGVKITVSTGRTFTKTCPPAEKWIEINLSSQILYAWQGKTLIASSYISSGKDGHWTPTGTFYINSKPGTIDMSGCSGGECWYVPDVPASMAFTYEGHYIHGAYWHNLFGQARLSHGCVNLPVDFAWWIFDWTPMWTKVVIHY